jgi:hypothetical protein
MKIFHQGTWLQGQNRLFLRAILLFLHSIPARLFPPEKQKTKKNHEAFVEKKKLQRQERMASKRAQPKNERNPKTMLDKARGIIKRAIGKLDTNTLYVFNEVLQNRYRMFAT